MGTAMRTLGTPTAAVIIMLAVLLQPFTGSVAVTVYVPAAVTATGLAELAASAPPFQTMLLPALTAVSVLLLTVQLKFPLLEVLITGRLVFDTTVTVSIAVQLLEGSVTTRVYTPPALAVLLADAAPGPLGFVH